ncbi:uncharacterized protein LOC126887243 [Diabrotica virgifera virgifera]|uniref:Uncharacterized protein LOC114346962 n=1 Tax=Diabrotica virgifera virgifera TaxID=50390 RepID=A0A6P7GUS1_DIAVI|nr:uncharacterized protein LOC126887243 [Diabrotica virgifera virgifera]
MEWSEEAIIEFLHLYENERVIWHPSFRRDKYSHHEVHDAWKRIQTEFSLKKSIEDLKKKREHLMGTFRKCVAKIKASEESGSDTDEKYKPKWFAFDIMARFLNHLIEPMETIKLEKVQRIPEEQDNYIENETQDDDISNIYMSSTEPKRLTTKRRATSNNSINKMTKSSKIAQDTTDDKVENDYDIFQEISQLTQKDEYDIFGELIAKRLRGLRQHERDYLMHEMENMMYQAKISSSQHTVQ